MRYLILAALVAAIPSAASASPGWITKCPYSHSNNDDPIKFPNQPGASHLHDFFGARTTDAFSTYSSLQASATTCGSEEDHAAYWAPALFKGGVRVLPAGSFNGRSVREQFYYRDNNLSSSLSVEPFPPNFRMIYGRADATSISDAKAKGAKWGSEIYYGCSNNSPDVKSTVPINCTTGIISLHIQFPNCWNGVQSGGDEIAAGNVKFPSSGVCPSGFNRRLPRLLARFEYPVGTSSSGITLSSGGTWTAHTDFINAWAPQSALNSLVQRCLNGNVDCGTNPNP